jgi:Dimethlysulfonioproprionate lyase
LERPIIQSFLTPAEAAIHHASGVDESVRVAAERIFGALRTPSGEAGRRGGSVACLPPSANGTGNARALQGAVGALADAFDVIERQLHWKIRAGAETQGESFLNGHANATIVGSEGLAIRRDVWIGVTLIVSHMRHPDHRHLPEEIYIALSSGEWRQASKPWHEPGIGKLVYNPPNVVHAICDRRTSRCRQRGSCGPDRPTPDPADHTAVRPPSTNRLTPLM